ncbi:MAG: hypothetical protein A2W61_00440 [Deltaproteobacteria bacterium RIFCSPLOWO2_01_44_7]|nr:MAG: hypothetical protein A2712_08935 [Deltaproteobacteria bacterium RIFCSPHIGHO2_01_FULL_43_49]OGQ14540.1 MAG: hypothetical protein A3D22_08065 [Deltaproteobacteria bacterium RIFCSPHIGHO2_02_FULL_44_53]OGQ27926.1 MAG: hypothetical protein A3D98_06775 [Deltaproteobacteria bacterium RIFCSPHIGHO2_12_FULL_44_21]OGQ31138.1 MAG: hypothetical protein A2979_06825 [Deltaproteobacteria bacterium RIFCSPLOWO2_01_FULL_45_74]OGQ39175.1 MAG: hypothetical protein A2W61_00440 [Deltaproteobacteria bacterium 
MFFVPGWIIGLATFPGVVAHEIGHRLFADWAKVPVYKVCYFQAGNPAGYVIHGPMKSLKSAFLISVGPLIVNTLLCAVITFPAVFPLFILDVEQYSWVFILLFWVGFSIGMHAFPSNEDMKNLVDNVKSAKQGGLLLLVAKFFAGLLRVANALRVIWFDAIYAFGIIILLPLLFGFL